MRTFTPARNANFIAVICAYCRIEFILSHVAVQISEAGPFLCPDHLDELPFREWARDRGLTAPTWAEFQAAEELQGIACFAGFCDCNRR